MTSDDISKFLGYVDDDAIVSALEETESIELRLLGLAELSRSAKGMRDLEFIKDEITQTFELFYERWKLMLPWIKDEDLWAFALPPLGLSAPERKWK